MSVRRIIERSQLFAILGFQVKNPDVYQTAFVHKSALRESGLPSSYERIEFLGDSVLDFVVARYLFDKYPTANEGFLTRVRTKLVSGKSLCNFARRLGLQQYVLMNQKALRQQWNNNDRILEDVFESLIACIYLDMGMLCARDFVLDVIERNTDWDEIVVDNNEKDILMRYTQANKLDLPIYELIDHGSPCDDMSDSSSDTSNNSENAFHVRVIVAGVERGRGRARTKRQAEQNSARVANDMLGVSRAQVTFPRSG